ncbi:cobaltochelatase CobN subunit [Nitrospirillum amazonense]|uniref:Cobaltochelatase subunit CobN n=1 Tax=Nitrospirillum amazonense TaxID=28077 RepID=A0A560EKL6_9PROT|nr:cobaltochelatase subunit CobN [Nitrospirillum amazonense]TWB09921.1 cobaltochelatase CobN subunit [Nitrospirillum amazonense]
MHLLPTQAEDLLASPQAEDLGQTPAECVLLSFSDSDLSAVATAYHALGDVPWRPTLRLANLMRLGHPLSVDMYVEAVVSRARLVVLRLNGGAGYWRYGLEQVAETCRARGIALAVVPGEAKADPSLDAAGTVDLATTHRLWRCFVEGGPENMARLLVQAAHLVGRQPPADLLVGEPTALPRYGRHEGWRPATAVEGPPAALVFYRSHLQAGNLTALHALADALARRGLAPHLYYAASLKEGPAVLWLAAELAALRPAVVLNATGFSARQGPEDASPLDAPGVPVLQAVLSTGTEALWEKARAGLGPADLAMTVVLPEMDGRLQGPAIAFKAAADWDAALEYAPTLSRPRADRVDALADKAVAWARLAATPPMGRRVALVLSDYPARGGTGLALGLDTPASTLAMLAALAGAGYGVADRPADGAALMAALRRPLDGDAPGLSLADYARLMDPAALAAITARWGPPSADPLAHDGALRFRVQSCGNVFVAVQPSRGHGVIDSAAHHDPDTPPSHGYAAFHLWLRHVADIHALVQVGAHGTLEWLPGKAVALSADCWPERLAGSLPVLYPYIATNPGEGVQARRRLGAVLVGHLPPPPVPAGLHGDLAALEQALDEYAQAQSLDPRRLPTLRARIRDLAWEAGVTRDLNLPANLATGDLPDEALARLDAHLCDIKEMQIRDGLHVFGAAPDDGAQAAFLAAMARFPRRDRPSMTEALARDLGLAGTLEDLFTGDAATPWPHPLPALLAERTGTSPTVGRVRAALDGLVRALVSGHIVAHPEWERAAAVLATLHAEVAPPLAASGPAEMAALLAGLDGRFVAPGPGGSPARGRADVLPTGRNLYAIDPRAVPTPSAWALGWKGADAVLTRHLQDQGDWPRQLVVDCWGSPTLRTGGEELAQALALMGVRPVWEAGSGRVTGVEVLPASVLGRPRVDVTLRISGLFRDMFPAQLALFDQAARKVAGLDEPDAVNPLATAVRADRDALLSTGMDTAEADRQATARVYGAAPGGYGTGLAQPLATGDWQARDQLGAAYLDTGCHAYGLDLDGVALPALFRRRVGLADALVHIQDQRETDVLDNDGMTQFEGGFAAAAGLLGSDPVLYHVDSAEPERITPRTLAEEAARVVRGRAANPRWIDGQRRHGHSGAANLARTVDGAVALAALTGAVRSHQVDSLYDAYVADGETWAFLSDSNPDAARQILDRFQEALQRGLWHPRRNSTPEDLTRLREELA